MPEDKLAQFRGPGLFYVLSRPKPSLPLEEFHHWYNTEHGPARLNLDFIPHGYRYRCREPDPSLWMAYYDLKRVSGLAEAQYTTLRDKRSDRESWIISHGLDMIDRRMYVDFSTRGASDRPAPVLLVVTMHVKEARVDEVDRWYEEEHLSDLAQIPGWIRSRRFRLISSDDEEEGMAELLAMHEFEAQNGLNGPEHLRAKSRPWRLKIVEEVIEKKGNRVFDFVHEFEAKNYRVPRPVDPTGSVGGPRGPTAWRLDGSHEPGAPVMVFSNALLTNYHIWDDTVHELSLALPGFCFLRYNTRGYEMGSAEKVTVDVLADDLAALLDHLQIRSCHVLIGVSLGGITAVNFAARYPSRVEGFVACDCNIASTEGNTTAWRARAALAQSDHGWSHLAEQTVQRWFTPQSVQRQTAATALVRRMILDASRQGFVNCVEALCDFDLTDRLRRLRAPGLLVVGRHDGVLPSVMEAFSQSVPHCSFVAIGAAGHLPMVEQTHDFVMALLAFVKSI